MVAAHHPQTAVTAVDRRIADRSARVGFIGQG